MQKTILGTRVINLIIKGSAYTGPLEIFKKMRT